MRGRGKWGAALITMLALAMLVAACGGSSSSAGSEQSGSTSSAGKEASEKESKAKGASKYTQFGEEAPSGEREAASTVLAQSLSARGSRDFAGQCKTLTVKLNKEYVERASFYKVAKTCAAVLGKEAENAPAKVLADNLEGEIVALRVKGNRGYAIYDGTDGKVYAMPMVLEGSNWKVGAVVATEVPEGKGSSSK